MSRPPAADTVRSPVLGTGLDGALVRLSPLEFPPPAYFANHGPMAAEALVTLGADDELPAWTLHFEAQLVPGPTAADADAADAADAAGWNPGSGWRDELGDRLALPRWYTYFVRVVEAEGWHAAVGRWVPRLAPAVSGGLFHGVIRTAHAVRSLDRASTPARRAELAQALAHWACWATPGRGAQGRGAQGRDDRSGLERSAGHDGDGPRGGALDLATGAAADFVVDPDIVTLHRVTGAMAVELLAPRLPEADGVALVGHLAAALGTPEVRPADGLDEDTWTPEVEGAARASFDAHQVKLVEACHRGYAASGAGAFAEAARVVTGVGPPTGAPTGAPSARWPRRR